MDISVEETGALARRMVVNVPEERILGEVQNRLKSLAKTTRIDGFRPGKVPLKVIQDRYGDQVREEVCGEVLRSSFQEAISSKNLKLAGAPAFPEQNDNPGDGMSYTATFEIFPEIELVIPEEFKVTRPMVDIQDVDIDAMVDTLRKQRAGWAEVSRPAEAGDRVSITYTATADGDEFDKGNDVPIVLGNNTLGFDGVEEAVAGASAGDDRTAEIEVPEDSTQAMLAGKTVKFAIKVGKVEGTELPALNDEFFQSFGITEGGVDAFRKEVLGNMEREREQVIKQKTKVQLFDALKDANTFEVPDSMIQRELDGNKSIPGAVTEDERRTVVEAKLKTGLLLNEIVKKEGLTADAGKVREALDVIASSYEEPAHVIEWYQSDRQRMEEIEAIVLEQAVADWIAGKCEFVEEQMSFDALMHPEDHNQE